MDMGSLINSIGPRTNIRERLEGARTSHLLELLQITRYGLKASEQMKDYLRAEKHWNTEKPVSALPRDYGYYLHHESFIRNLKLNFGRFEKICLGVLRLVSRTYFNQILAKKIQKLVKNLQIFTDEELNFSSISPEDATTELNLLFEKLTSLMKAAKQTKADDEKTIRFISYTFLPLRKNIHFLITSSFLKQNNEKFEQELLIELRGLLKALDEISHNTTNDPQQFLSKLGSLKIPEVKCKNRQNLQKFFGILDDFLDRMGIAVTTPYSPHSS